MKVPELSVPSLKGWHRYINTKILILSGKEYNASKHVRNVQAIIRRCPGLAYLTFSKVTESGLQLSGAVVENDLSLATSGIYSSIEGSRADVIIPDDCEVKANSATVALREKLLRRFSEVSAILHPAGRCCSNQDIIPVPERTQAIYIGTPQSEFTVYSAPENDEGHPLSMANRITVPALHEGRSTFPERFSTAMLSLKRKQMSTPEWYLQMMLDPTLLDRTQRVIKVESMKWASNVEITDPLVTVDPVGDSGRGKDEAAISVTGIRKEDGRMVHVAAIVGLKNKTGEEVVVEALTMAKKYGASKIIVESNFNAYSSLFKATASRLGQSVQIIPIRSTVRKRERLIETLEVPINSGRVSFDEAIKQDKETMFQFKAFTYSAEPEPNDRLDALSFALSYWEEKGLFRHSSAFKWESATMLN